ncbi:hypothetical protein SSX86_006468 [Deinandra increscens subsp. villosa]|uniref:Shikimate dehydrogenase substrate binding N-terminal domain-containing protein n=1 Tax=Deinandra increscens subsp. villosa TaxID=3103831 RepID=A0AAP0H5P8_9ASTR
MAKVATRGAIMLAANPLLFSGGVEGGSSGGCSKGVNGIKRKALSELRNDDCGALYADVIASSVSGVCLFLSFAHEFALSKFGGYLTFGTLERGKESAPGQPTIKDLLDLFNFRQLRPDTKVFGIIGKPVGHSKSPMLYNKAFRSVGFNGVFVHMLVDNVKNFLETYSSRDFAGFSCTIPYKEAVVQCCDEVDPVAKAIGAVNCVIRRQNDRRLYGCNTDYVGAISAIEDGLRGFLLYFLLEVALYSGWSGQNRSGLV